MESISVQARAQERFGFGSYLFEIIGRFISWSFNHPTNLIMTWNKIAMLDGSIRVGRDRNSREFTIKDDFERMNCKFSELDGFFGEFSDGSALKYRNKAF